MAIPSRGIGWSTEDNLLWQISKQLEQLTNVTAKSCANNAPTYKVYTALLNQSGSNDPVATVLENTLGGTPVWTRSGTGTYICTLTGAFTINKTFCSITYGPNNGIVPLLPHFGPVNVGFGSGDICNMTMYNSLSGTAIDPNNDNGNDICVEIRVYN